MTGATLSTAVNVIIGGALLLVAAAAVFAVADWIRDRRRDR